MEVNSIDIYFCPPPELKELKEFTAFLKEKLDYIRLGERTELHWEKGMIVLKIWRANDWITQNQKDDLNQMIENFFVFARLIVNCPDTMKTLKLE